MKNSLCYAKGFASTMLCYDYFWCQIIQIHKSIIHKSIIHKSIIHKSIIHKSIIHIQNHSFQIF
jgi:hypothetical protein